MMDFETPTYLTAKEAQHMQSQVGQWKGFVCESLLLKLQMQHSLVTSSGKNIDIYIFINLRLIFICIKVKFSCLTGFRVQVQ